ncbi:MAG: PorP/SprF family type IX secretion system membrane protein [Bacteroidales bacterium]|nr:PorP/SprF family type IX secretion system membrane protein [Bacteroidales bacterium]
MNFTQRIILSLCLCVGTSTMVLAQDIHFSNFFTNSLNVNPAMTGYMKGKWRFNITARDQYRTVAVPYKTLSLGIDTRLKKKYSSTSSAGIGLLFNYDLSGDAQYSALQIAVPVALHLPLNQWWRLSPALMPGVGFHSLDYSLLRFPDQFNGTHFDPNLITNENFELTRKTFFTMGAGFMATFTPSSLYSYTLGYAAYNINRPNISWFNNTEAHLPLRSLIHGMAWLQLSSDFDFVPQAKVQFQGSQQEFQFDAIGIKYFNNSSLYKCLFGVSYRAKNNDALIVTIGCNVSGYDIIFNYDINISQLRTASRGHGAFELTVTNIILDGRKRTKRAAVRCPGYI